MKKMLNISVITLSEAAHISTGIIARCCYNKLDCFQGYSFNVESYFEEGCRKNVYATIPRGNMGYVQYTVSCRTYFCCFPLALTDICPWALLPFYQISLKTSELNTTHNTRVVTKISSCRVNTTSRQGIKRLRISFGSIFLLFSNKSSWGPLSQQLGKIPGPRLFMTTLQYLLGLLPALYPTAFLEIAVCCGSMLSLV